MAGRESPLSTPLASWDCALQGTTGSIQNPCRNNANRPDAALPSLPLPQAVHMQENQVNGPISKEGQMPPEDSGPQHSAF